jgi:hypothetical protein
MRMPLTVDELRETVKKTFPAMQTEKFEICYFDDEGDTIDVTDNDDYMAAYDFQAETGNAEKKTLKFYVRVEG